MQHISVERIGGIGDEAAIEANQQIAVHRDLGLRVLELRTVGGQAIADLPLTVARHLADQIQAAGLRVCGIASRIGNWARPITAPFQADLDELTQLTRIAPLLGTHSIRVMTYPNDGLSEVTWEQAVLKRFQTLTARARDSGLHLWVENCSGWVQSDAQRYLSLQDSVGADVMGFLFDIGNPVAYGYDGFDYLKTVLPHTEHIHIKDGMCSNGDTQFTLPGAGEAEVLKCVTYALDHGYEGDFCFEPHLAMIPHLGIQGDPVAQLESYKAYTRAFFALLGERFTRESIS